MIPFRIVRPTCRLSAAALLAAFIGLALPGQALAVDFAKSTGNQTYSDGLGHSMPYRLFLPDGYNAPGAEYPLVLFLHGAGERGTNNTAQCNTHIENLFAATQGSFGHSTRRSCWRRGCRRQPMGGLAVGQRIVHQRPNPPRASR